MSWESDSRHPSDDATNTVRLTDPGTRLRVGSVFAHRFEVSEFLGAGSTGEVFEVRDRFNGQSYALKVLHSAGLHQAQRERLARELRLAASIDHRNVVRVHETGAADGLSYLLMERLTGESLKDRLRRAGPLKPEQAREVLIGVLSALASAHEHGIIHRDVKPANIFLADDREAQGAPRAVLLDFGISQHVDDETMTMTGVYMGTPSYMSPEQVEGRAEPDPRTDLYSLGVVCWEMLSGSRPFHETTIIGLMHAHATAALPSTRRALRGTPAWLRDLTAWSLAKKPARRPASARVLLDYVKSRRGRTYPSSIVANLRGDTRGGTRRIPLAIAAVVFVLVAAFALLFPVSWDHEDRSVRVHSLAGLNIRSWEMPAHVKELVPLPSTLGLQQVVLMRRQVQVNKPYPEEYYAGLAVLNARSGTLKSFADTTPQISLDTKRLPQPYPGYDSNYNALSIEPYELEDGSRGFIVVYNMADAQPAMVRVYDTEGNTLTRFHHFGRVSDDVVVVDRSEAGKESLVVFAAASPLFGSRAVVGAFGFHGDRVHQLREERMHQMDDEKVYVAPPMAGVGEFLARPEYYQTTDDETLISLSSRDGVGVLQPVTGGRETLFSLEEGPNPHADDPVLWALLEDVARSSEPHVARTRVEPLLQFAENQAANDVHRQVARLAAAQSMRRAGRCDDALSIAKELIRAPDTRHGERLEYVELSSLCGARDEDVQVEFDGTGRLPLGLYKLTRAKVLACLADNDVECARSVPLPKSRADHRYRRDLTTHMEVAIHLHLAESPPAIELLDLHASPCSYPRYAFLKAMSWLVSDDPQPERALAKLEEVEAGQGSGVDYPIELAREYAKATINASRSRVREADIEAWLARAERAKRNSVLEQYLETWALAFAAGIARTHGDDVTARARLDRIEPSMRTAPFVQRLARAAQFDSSRQSGEKQ